MLRVVAQLCEGLSEVLLDEESSRYVVKVHRKVIGAEILVFDPRSGLCSEARLESDRLPRIRVSLNSLRPAARQEMPVTLAVAVGKHDKPEQAMRDVTALGAERLVLLHGQRSVARSDSASRSERLLRVGEQVARQCGRGHLPQLTGPLNWEEFATALPESATRLVCAFDEKAQPLLSLLVLDAEQELPVVVVVGPEGGFSAGELEFLNLHGFRTVDLGPYVLRTELAVTAVLSTLRAEFVRRRSV